MPFPVYVLDNPLIILIYPCIARKRNDTLWHSLSNTVWQSTTKCLWRIHGDRISLDSVIHVR